MKKMMWGLLAIAEFFLAFVLAHPAILNMLMISRTRKTVLEQDSAYFAGMLFGDVIRGLPACLLVCHAILIGRKLFFKGKA